MQRKKGISLIVLVITIIVMIILAATIILAINNNNVVDKAKDAVTETNYKQVQELAQTAWADAYIDGLRGETLKNEVLGKLEDYKDKYNFEVTDAGVTVSIKDETTEDEEEEETTPVSTITLNATTITETIESGATKDVTITATTANVIETLTWTTNDNTVATVIGNGSTATVTLKGAGTAIITVTANGVSATCTITVKVRSTLGELVTSAADYGKTVNYEANEVTDWKVFYETDDYVYLIASEKLAYDKVPITLNTTAGATIASATITLSDNTTRTVGQVYWDSSDVPTSAGTIQNPTMWMANWSNYSTNINGRCVSYFLDETHWTAFKNTTASYASYVKGAIGTPTAELFVASWNAKRAATNDTTTYNKKLSLVANGTTGYYVNDITESNPASSNTTIQTISTSDTLYIWSKVSNSYTWLASPSGYNTNNLFIADINGNVYGNSYSNTYLGVRPVVCLSSNIPAVAGSTTDFEI